MGFIKLCKKENAYLHKLAFISNKILLKWFKNISPLRGFKQFKLDFLPRCRPYGT